MSDEVDKKEYNAFKEKHEITEEEEVEFSFKGTVMITKDGPAGAAIETTVIGRSDVLIQTIMGAMEKDESVEELLLEATAKYAMKKMSARLLGKEPEDVEEMIIDDELKDRLKLSGLFSGLKPDAEC